MTAARVRVVDHATLVTWLRTQRINLERHATGLRPFRPHEFGRGGASPSEAHRRAANELIDELRRSLLVAAHEVAAAEHRADMDPSFRNLQVCTTLKERGQTWVKATELVWDFYFRLFSQRQTGLGRLLLGTDRIGLDCYQAIYTRLGVAKSIPSPPPFSYVKSGLGPATYRRRVILAAVGRRKNPFPLIELPYHRLLNPWALGAVPHEVAHNIQADLGLWDVVPRAIRTRLVSAGIDAATAETWAHWHKEVFADLCSVLLIGPAAVASLTSIVGNSPVRTLSCDARAVHPCPYLRVLINLELLRRTGFEPEARELGAVWNRLYPARFLRGLPTALLRTFARANRLVVDAICFQAHAQLGGRSLADVVGFGANDQAMATEAAGRLAAGVDPGIVPERFLIPAARVALDRRLARPGVISQNFYNALERR